MMPYAPYVIMNLSTIDSQSSKSKMQVMNLIMDVGSGLSSSIQYQRPICLLLLLSPVVDVPYPFYFTESARVVVFHLIREEFGSIC